MTQEEIEEIAAAFGEERPLARHCGRLQDIVSAGTGGASTERLTVRCTHDRKEERHE